LDIRPSHTCGTQIPPASWLADDFCEGTSERKSCVSKQGTLLNAKNSDAFYPIRIRLNSRPSCRKVRSYFFEAHDNLNTVFYRRRSPHSTQDSRSVLSAQQAVFIRIFSALFGYVGYFLNALKNGDFVGLDAERLPDQRGGIIAIVAVN